MKFKKPYTQYEGKWIKWNPGKPYRNAAPKYFLVKFLRVSSDRIIFWGVVMDYESTYRSAIELNFPTHEDLDFTILNPEQSDYKEVVINVWTRVK